MIHEIVIQAVDPAKRDEYIQEFGQILKDADFAGSRGIKLVTSIEDPNRVILMIEWIAWSHIRLIAARRRTITCVKSLPDITRRKVKERISYCTK